jgi:hypothetical protein
MRNLHKSASTDEQDARKLPAWLREIRTGTFRELAERAGRGSHTPLWRAANWKPGEPFPSQDLVVGYAVACGAEPAEARARWTFSNEANLRMTEAANYFGTQSPTFKEVRNKVEALPRMINPHFIGEPREVLDAMRVLRQTAGSPSLRAIECAAVELGCHPLPRSTLSDVLSDKRSFPSREFFLSYLTVMRVPLVDHGIWEKAWNRAALVLDRGEPQGISRTALPGQSPAIDLVRALLEATQDERLVYLATHGADNMHQKINYMPR